MAFSTTLAQPAPLQPKQAAKTTDTAAPLLAALVLSVFAAQKSKKGIAKLKRQAMLNLVKFGVKERFNRFKSLFSKKADVSNRTLLYILLGLIVLALIFVEPIIALVVLLVGVLILLLTGRV